MSTKRRAEILLSRKRPQKLLKCITDESDHAPYAHDVMHIIVNYTDISTLEDCLHILDINKLLSLYPSLDTYKSKIAIVFKYVKEYGQLLEDSTKLSKDIVNCIIIKYII